MSTLNENTIIGVVGAGTMGAGIAQVAANAGHNVYLYDNNVGAAQKGIDGVAKGLQRLIAKGKKTQQQVEEIIARITPCEQIEQLVDAGLVIEAIVENLQVKQLVFSQLQNLCAEDTVLATNTSSISVTSIAAGLDRPEQLIGMHFFNPAPIMKLVEVISGLATEPLIAEQVYQLAYSWGKKPVYAKSTPGFIVNRVARPYYGEALRVLQEGGTDCATIDTIMKESAGFRMGPIELTDLIGQDINYSVTCSVFDAFYHDQRFTPSLLQLELVNAGHLGRKTGRGFYDYNNPVNMQASTAEMVKAPTKIIAYGQSATVRALTELAKNANIAIEPIVEDNELNGFKINGTWITQTDGRLASQYSAEECIDDCVFFDLALDYYTSTRMAVTKSMQCSEQALNDAVGFFQAIGKQVSIIKDLPGMLAMRTVCMLVNEGADAVNQQVCSIEAVDIAMQGGVNYPKGPMAWADQLGLENVIKVLDNMAQVYGEDRYRVSPLLSKYLYAKQSLLK